MIFNMTGGGNPLNFKVVGGTAEPSNPKENTIWVNTDKEITGWHFATEQPDDMKEGEVWFSTGTYSTTEFNALKKNGIQVYPISAKQYVGGAWVNKVAKSYQGGAWVDLRVYLYNDGNEFIDITGGWGGYPNAKYDYFDPIKKRNYIELKGVYGINYGYGGTSKKIVPDNALYVEMSVTNYNEQSCFGVATNAYDCIESYIAKVEISSNSNRTVYSLPLDGVTEPVYVTFTSGGDTLLTIYKVWME